MTAATRRKTSLTLDGVLLDEARALGLNVSAVADAALRQAVEEAQRREWLEENSEAFTAQAAWHDRHGHPLADILAIPGGGGWKP